MNLEKVEKDQEEEEAEEEEEVNFLFFSQEDNADHHQDELDSSPCLGHQCSTTTPLQQDRYYPYHQVGMRMVNKNINLAVLEILRDRREAIESGRLKKKRLTFEAFEDASDQMDNPDEVKENDMLRCGCCTCISPKSSTTTSDADVENNDECTAGRNCNFNYSSNTSTASSSSSLEEEIPSTKVEGGGDQEGKRVGDDPTGKWVAKIAASFVVVTAVVLGLIINLWFRSVQ